MKKKFNYKIFLYCMFISLVMLLFTSKSSPFYPFNDWVDANAFLTVGKSIMRGLVPYKDIFEQKGPLLYLIFGIASLMSSTSFIGVFILEVIFMSFTLYFSYLIMRMFLSKRISLLLLPVFLMLLVTCKSFSHGASSEEFMLLFEAITLYYFIRHFRERRLTNKEYIIVGVLAGIVLLIKYTLFGLWISFIGLTILDDFLNKEYQNGMKKAFYYLIGFLIPIIITFIYFGINHGIKDFINVYFVINIASYSEKISLIRRPFEIIKAFIICLGSNNLLIIGLVLLYPVMVYKLELERKNKNYLIILFVLTVLIVFYGLKLWSYYALPIVFLMLLTLIGFTCFVKKFFLRKKIKRFYLVLIITLIISFVSSYYFSPNKEYHRIKKEEMLQYKYAKIINGDSFVNMGFGDIGIYNIGNIYPNTYFFELQNIPYNNFKDNIDAFKDYIKNKVTKYIVYIKDNKEDIYLENDTLIKNYDMIEEDVYEFENQKYYASLWRVK